MVSDLYEKIRKIWRTTLKPSVQNVLANKRIYISILIVFLIQELILCSILLVHANNAAAAAGMLEQVMSGGSGVSDQSTFIRMELGQQRALCLLALSAWAVSSFLVMWRIFSANLERNRYVYGLFITFGADTRRMRFILSLDVLLIALVSLPVSWLLAGLVCSLIYHAGGAGCSWSAWTFFVALGLEIAVTVLCIGIQVGTMIRKPCVVLLASQGVEDYVVSPRRSYNVTGKNQPLRLAALGLWRMRRYYLPLFLCSAILCGLFCGMTGLSADSQEIPDTAAQYVIRYNRQADTAWQEQVTAVEGVTGISGSGDEDADIRSAQTLGTHMVVLPSDTGIETGAEYDTLYGVDDVLVYPANTETNSALGYTFLDVSQGYAQLILSTSGRNHSFTASVGERIYLRNGETGSLTPVVIRLRYPRSSVTTPVLLLNPADYEAVTGRDVFDWVYTERADASALSISKGEALIAAPRAVLEAAGISDGDTVTLCYRFREEDATPSPGIYYSGPDELLEAGTITLEDEFVSFTARLLETEGGRYMIFRRSDNSIGAFDLSLDYGSDLSVLDLSDPVGGKSTVSAGKTLMFFAEGDIDTAGSVLSIPARLTAADLNKSDDEYMATYYAYYNVRPVIAVTEASGRKLVFATRQRSSFTTDNHDPVMTYGDAYYLRTDSANLKDIGSAVLITEDQFTSYTQPQTYGKIHATDRFAVLEDPDADPGKAVLLLPQSSTWELEAGRTVQLAEPNDADVRKYADSDMPLTGDYLLELRFRNLQYRYVTLTLTEVKRDPDVTEPVFILSGKDYLAVAGTAGQINTLQVYVKAELDTAKIKKTEESLTALVAKISKNDPDAGISLEKTGEIWRVLVMKVSNLSPFLLELSILVLSMLPFLWYFTSSCFYKKREKEYQLLFYIGKEKAFLNRTAMTECLLSAALSAVTTMALIPLMRVLLNGALGVIGSSLRLGPVSWPVIIATVMANMCCAFFAAWINYRISVGNALRQKEA